ncbi:MAG: F0F1 ATP synthase subunit B [Gammaproteobacteria bacterium]|nr:F0F1 ATP synthase subunit B [Gammaproteobacteria bacterium]
MNIGLTLIGQTIAFFVFVWICWRYIWPPITEAMAERQKQIAHGLQAAERASQDLELAQKRATDELKAAKEEAAALVEQARQRAMQMVDEAKEDARDEGERMKDAARSEIERELNRAREDLRKQVAVLAVAGAEKILEQSVDDKAHAQMLEQLSAQL